MKKVLLQLSITCSIIFTATFNSLLFSQNFQCFSTGTASTSVDCGTLSNYVPQATDRVKTVKIAFHVMQRESPFPKDNFDENNPAHSAYLNAVFNRVNSLYTECNWLWCEGTYVAPLNPRDSRIRFELVGTYFHRDNAGYINEDGTYDNSYCYDNYGICKDEVLNVFFCQIPDGTSGYGPTSHVMLFNLYDDYINNGTNDWGHGNLLGHEFGHVFGLNHSWVSYQSYPDMCQDPLQSGAWCHPSSSAPHCTNNMMAYSALNDFISPLQMARMNLTLLTGTASKYLKTESNVAQDITVNTPTTWDYSRMIFGDVIIEPGAELIIQCKTIMAPGKRIIVKRGARLIVDGARITTKGPARTTCNGATKFERWTGIEVWGNVAVTTSENMLEEDYSLQTSDPGVVILKNHAIIENAQVGIFAQQRGYPWASQLEHFGGLIFVDGDASNIGGELLNCRKAVEYISHYPLTISSTFEHCKISQSILNTSQSNPAKTYEGVTSWQVSGMKFDEKCEFMNLERAIVLGNATATVLGSEFTLNKYGVEMGMTSPTADAKTFIGGGGAGGNTFKYCDWSVHAKAYGFLIVINNLFEDCYNGVALIGTSIYKIEENEFRNTTINNNPASVAGIGLFQSGEAAANLIYCNEYNTVGSGIYDPLIKDGIFVGGNNNGTYFNANKFDCWWDVRLSHLDNPGNPGDPFKGDLPNQGGNGNPVFNEFTNYSIYDHKAEIFTPNPILNVTEPFRYYHPGNTCPSQLIPRCPYEGTCSNLCSKYLFANEEGGNASAPICSFGPVDGLLQPGDCRIADCLENYYIGIRQLDSLLKPGFDPSLYIAIQSAPNHSVTLNTLYQASPYLSEDVLATMLNSAMSGTNKRDVLAENLPLSPYILNLAVVHLSPNEYAYLTGLQQPGMESLRDRAAQERKGLNSRKMSLLHHLTDSLYRIGDVSYAAQLWENDPERFSREALVGLKLQTKDYTGASQLLAGYPTADPEDARYKLIQTVNLNHQTLGETFQVVPQDSAALFDIAYSYSAQAGYAQTLLGILYDASFEPNYPEVPEEREDAGWNNSVTRPANDKLLAVYPNPTSDVLTINVRATAVSEKSRIFISSIYGKLIGDYSVDMPVMTINVAYLIPGFYSVAIVTENGETDSRHFVKVNH